MTDNCPLCQAVLQSSPEPTSKDAKLITCPRCGRYELDGSFAAVLPRFVEEKPKQAAVASHVIRRTQSGQKPPFLGASLWESIVENVPAPSPAEQAENVILWLGSIQNAPGELVNVELNDRALVGALSDHNFVGWEAYGQLQRESPRQTRRAFMAMLYGDPHLDKIFASCFKPAVARTGFELFRLDEQPRAGLIDDRLRLEIRRSRFLLADLTHGSHGAYWEAGYAEGLGKPVIYTCERTEFEKRGTHFDTNHLHTVIWEETDLQSAADRLALTIRTTLPDEAKLED